MPDPLDPVVQKYEDQMNVGYQLQYKKNVDQFKKSDVPSWIASAEHVRDMNDPSIPMPIPPTVPRLEVARWDGTQVVSSYNDPDPALVAMLQLPPPTPVTPSTGPFVTQAGTPTQDELEFRLNVMGALSSMNATLGKILAKLPS